MTHATAESIWSQISETKQAALKRQLLEAAVAYARIRTDWHLRSQAERSSMSAHRTAAHNALIDACNILTRAMLNPGEPVHWRETLGNERKEIGDFACFLHCFLGLDAR